MRATSEPNFTLLIPTRDRCDVLGPCLRTAVAQQYGRLQILVSDNFSTDDTREVTASICDSRVRYIRTPKRMGMSEHWEWALRHVEPGWVGILGDDDGLVEGCVERVAELAMHDDIDAVRTGRAHFAWPSTDSGSPVGQLTFYRRSGTTERASHDVFVAALAHEIPFNHLPVLYTGGWIRTNAIDAARDGRGNFYRSAIPDIYSGIALSCTTRRIAYALEPLAIDGSSRHSNGAAHLRGGESAKAQSLVFWQENLHRWHSSVPMLPGAQLSRNPYAVQMESYLQASHLLPQKTTDWKEHVTRAIYAQSVSPHARTEAERQWVQDLAKQNGVDFVAASRQARAMRARYLLSPRTISEKFLDSAMRQTIRSSRLTDVHQAAKHIADSMKRELSITSCARSMVAGAVGIAAAVSQRFIRTGAH